MGGVRVGEQGRGRDLDQARRQGSGDLRRRHLGDRGAHLGGHPLVILVGRAHRLAAKVLGLEDAIAARDDAAGDPYVGKHDDADGLLLKDRIDCRSLCASGPAVLGGARSVPSPRGGGGVVVVPSNFGSLQEGVFLLLRGSLLLADLGSLLEGVVLLGGSLPSHRVSGQVRLSDGGSNP